MKLVKDINKESSNKPQVTDKEAEEAIKKLLAWMGEDPNREGLIETPKRVVKAFKEYFNCLLYTSPSPRDKRQSRMPSSA